MGLGSLVRRFGLGEQHTLVFETPLEYRTTLAYLDAKEFGVPQTRQRKCMPPPHRLATRPYPCYTSTSPHPPTWQRPSLRYMLIYQPTAFGSGVAPADVARLWHCLLYTSPSPRDRQKSRMPSSA